jgi:hypothetical protein
MWKRAAFLCLLALAVLAADATAQTRVRVTDDGTTVWRANFITVETIVPAGMVLEVLRRQGEFYEVVVPPGNGKPRVVGFVSVRRVQYLDGPPLPAPQSAGPRVTPARREPTPVAARRPPPKTSFRWFGNVAYGQFTASHSFDAVLGQQGGPWFGGGGEFRSGPWFATGMGERFRETGERVFVFNDQVFKLGIADTVTVVPITFTGGYRRLGKSMSPYVGGGVGQYRYKEESAGADPAENFKDQFTSYHVLGGVEWRAGGLLGAAVEFQYTAVPNALNGGAAAAFDEHDLGGIQVRVKILVGR